MAANENTRSLQAQIDVLTTRQTATELRLSALELEAPEPAPIPPPEPTPSPPPSGPLATIGRRIAGMNIGDKNYDEPAYQAELAKAYLVVLGIYPGWRGDVGGNKMGEVVRALKALNPEISIGNYTVLNECGTEQNPAVSASADIAQKLFAEEWWLRNAAGELMQYTSTYSKYDINFTAWPEPDASGLRFPQWLAKRQKAKAFGNAGFDFGYSDNAMKYYRGGPADWKLSGVDHAANETDIQQAWRVGQAAYWQALGAECGFGVMGNPDNDLSYTEYKEKLFGAFFEGAIGKSYSMKTWELVWARYSALQNNVQNRKRAIFNVSGALNDKRLLLFGLAICLLGDGMFCFTDAARGYSSVPWFPEYDLRFGDPYDPVPVDGFANAIWARRYAGGAALVNTSPETSYMTDAFSGQYHYPDGSPVGSITMSPNTGLLIVKNVARR